MTRPGTKSYSMLTIVNIYSILYCSDRNISWYILRMPKSKHLNYHTELSENSDKWLSMPTVKPLTIHTIMKDYSDKLKSGLIECTKNLVQSLTSKWISVV